MIDAVRSALTVYLDEVKSESCFGRKLQCTYSRNHWSGQSSKVILFCPFLLPGLDNPRALVHPFSEEGRKDVV